MNIEAYILVGGRSTRLGRDKALERVGGKTLAELAFAIVEDSQVASKTTFVAADEIGFAIEARRLDAPFVFDIVEGRGPLGGLYTALANATADWIFLLACDLPLITSNLLRQLAAFISPEFGVVVPEQPDGRLQPLCAFYNVKMTTPVVEQIINRRRVSPPMHEIINQLNPRIVRTDEYYIASAVNFANINTEKDLEIARKMRNAEART